MFWADGDAAVTADSLLLAGDVGGTKTNLAIVSRENGPRAPIGEARFPSGKYPSLEALVQEFLSKTGRSVGGAVFGVAGPVVGDEAQITNLPWTIDARQLRESLGVSSVRLLNDLQAIASAVPHLEPEDLHTVNVGKPVDHGSIGVVAPGTGLGESFLTWDGSRYQAHASEGGHTDFGPTNELQRELLQYLQDRFDHVSYERVCSGIGIPNIYAYLKESGSAEEPAWLAEKLSRVNDRVPVIVESGLGGGASEICARTLDLFTAILGAEAGNMALKVLATGGIYLGGGLPPRILPYLDNDRFMQAFLHKGRFVELLQDVPVHVILNPKAALLGAAFTAMSME